MRKALGAMTALSALLLWANDASPQVAIGSVRVSADRLPVPGEDTANYWGIGGGTASAANRDIDHGATRGEERPRADDGRK
jgi:hypothetical protein